MAIAQYCLTVQVSPDATGRDADQKRLHDTTMLGKVLLFVTKKSLRTPTARFPQFAKISELSLIIW
jgi:hypothetical protein